MLRRDWRVLATFVVDDTYTSAVTPSSLQLTTLSTVGETRYLAHTPTAFQKRDIMYVESCSCLCGDNRALKIINPVGVCVILCHLRQRTS